jgi:hypothetical protein
VDEQSYDNGILQKSAPLSLSLSLAQLAIAQFMGVVGHKEYKTLLVRTLGK